MQIVILTDENLKNELSGSVETLSDRIVWVGNLSQMLHYKNADAYIDLLFEKEHTDSLKQLLPALVVINCVEHPLTEIHSSFVRINGWPTLLKSGIIEATTLHENNKGKADELFSYFNKKIEWLPDEPGFVTARVISMIINEAFLSLKEGVSNKEEIDTAMKLGTNYPYGPFEWAERIGEHRIASLFLKLNREYTGSNPITL